MPPTNSLGAGPLRNRTINVEVNLLGEWLETRAKLNDDRLRWTGFLTAAALFAVVVLPLLSELAAHQQGRLRRAVVAAQAQQTAFDALQAELSSVQPSIDGEATWRRSREHAGAFLGEIMAVMNAKTPKMAFDIVEGSVLGGEVSIKTKAQAESYLDAQEFVAAAGVGQRVKSSILATARRDQTLHPNGVSFEFAKKVEVGK